MSLPVPVAAGTQNDNILQMFSSLYKFPVVIQLGFMIVMRFVLCT